MMQHSSKDLLRMTVSDKSFKDRAYEIARSPEYDKQQRALGSMAYKFFNQKRRSGVSVNKELPRITQSNDYKI